MARDFSAVGTSSGTTRATGSTSGSSGSGLFGLPKWVLALIAICVALVLAFVVSLMVSGSNDDADGGGSSDAIRAAHGPTTTIDGVPAGYTRDQAGAQTAAVNFTQANGQAYAGRIDAQRLKDVAVAAEPTPALTEVLDVSSERQETGRGTVNGVPMIVTVENFSQDSATVSVWGMGVSQSRVSQDSDKVGILAIYSTTTVTMVWENDDWKAKDWTYESGPTLEEAQFPADESSLAKQAADGFYAFYVN
ncbi:hypothetical protein CH299_28600 [Rhodococcus sp. 14-2686-1-2]|nr:MULTISPECIES: hypothetical protein [unclassified Rhodococcus (in: high G+C Gram-positive bacteria)]OZE92875.1 hypothetical protein CH301_28080 [Rhodococcus sp. 15-1189-1-1a]OZF08131.1 hypothetical protein CH299_28600 [Rhodococcus sp. 14-2686-1-2]